MIEKELKAISLTNITVLCDRTVKESELSYLKDEYDAIYIGTGQWEKGFSINPDTFQIADTPFFAGGRLCGEGDSVIRSVSTGKRAAISIERYLKKISLTASREREGSFPTPLEYPTIKEIGLNGNGPYDLDYTQEEAEEEAKRCLTCQCDACINGCSHLKRFRIRPKSYGRQIKINEDVIMGTRYANTMINSCTMCGLCKEECFTDIGMDELVRETRVSMVEHNKMPPSAHDFALRDMEFSNGSQFFMAKPPPPIPEAERQLRERELFTYPRIAFSSYAQSVFKGSEPDCQQSDYVFFPGCQLSASCPQYVEKTYEYLLDTIKEGVGIMLGCCGAPADWAGRNDLLEETLARMRENWIKMGKPIFIFSCSSCIRIFEKYLPEISFLSLWEIFQRYGLPEQKSAGKDSSRLDEKITLNVHDACSTRYNKEVHESVRWIVSQLGYAVEELKYTKERTKCCGFGGLVFYANRDQAKDFVLDRTRESQKDLLVYCAMCKDLFVDMNQPTFHVLDLIFSEDLAASAQRRMPNLSQKNENRRLLKRRLISRYWGDEKESTKEEQGNKVITIDKEIWDLMESRYILYEDVKSVLIHGEKTENVFYQPEENTYLSHLRIKNITYWVKYKMENEMLKVIRVYSHRMEVMDFSV